MSRRGYVIKQGPFRYDTFRVAPDGAFDGLVTNHFTRWGAERALAKYIETGKTKKL